MPGVVGGDGLNLKDKGLMGGSDMSVSGNPTTNNMWMVDGVNNNDVGSNRTVLIYPSVEAIDEIKVHRNAYGAEFGGGSGAQVNLVTRGGTNEFHGSAFYFGRTDALVSKNYFLEKANQPKQDLSRNDFGFTIGGPIIKDKLHFFASAEWNNEDRGIARSAARAHPGRAQRRLQPADGLLARGPDRPAHRPALPRRHHPREPAQPRRPGLPAALQPAQHDPDRRELQQLGHLGHDPHPLQPDQRPHGLGGQPHHPPDAPLHPGQLEGQRPERRRAALGRRRLPGGRLELEPAQPLAHRPADPPARLDGHEHDHVLLLGEQDRGHRWAARTPAVLDTINQAIPTMFPTSGKLHGADQGSPVFWGGAGYSSLWNEAPFLNNQDLFVLRDDYAAVFGKHFVKAGVLVSTNAKNEDTGGGNGEQSNFWGSTGLNGWGGTTGNLLADFLLKDMGWGFSESSTAITANTRWKDLEFYVNDTWKVRPNVTLDLGVRYSVFMNPYDANDKAMSFDPALFNAALGNDPCNGMWQPEGTTWCQEAGFKGGTRGLEPLA